MYTTVAPAVAARLFAVSYAMLVTCWFSTPAILDTSPTRCHHTQRTASCTACLESVAALLQAAALRGGGLASLPGRFQAGAEASAALGQLHHAALLVHLGGQRRG